ncbi:MAG: chemotaxis protein CheW [Gottschalkiaceae bacterium]|nr:MAG: chemotaxis protein CheW [Gottschalkiaceae bacterium]
MDYSNSLKQFVIFKLSNEEYGIDILRVKTIEKMSNITRVPKTSPYVKGVINLRGEVVPIIDLREKFNLNSYEENEDTRIIIVYIDDITVGLIVDSVSEVIEMDSSLIEEPPESIGNVEISNIYGIGNLNGRVIILLDVYKILNS